MLRRTCIAFRRVEVPRQERLLCPVLLQVTKEQRGQAKQLTYAIIYGMVGGLDSILGCAVRPGLCNAWFWLGVRATPDNPLCRTKP